jgi:hypothetical protein
VKIVSALAFFQKKHQSTQKKTRKHTKKHESPFGLKDWHRNFGGSGFLRIFSYPILWFIGKQMNNSLGLHSYGLISQENKHELRALGNFPGGKTVCSCCSLDPARGCRFAMLAHLPPRVCWDSVRTGISGAGSPGSFLGDSPRRNRRPAAAAASLL